MANNKNKTTKSGGKRFVKWTKRIVLSVFVLLVFFVGAAIAVPYFFKDEILAVIKKQANEQLNATVDFKDVHLSLIWTFPEFSLAVDELSVTGKGDFEGVKLADIEKFSFHLDLWSVFSGKYKVKKVIVDKPKFYVKVLNNGKANYDIVKTDSTSSEENVQSEDKEEESTEGGFNLQLNYYAINEADIVYNDVPSGMYVKAKNLSHSGRGKFMDNLYDVYTKTTIDELTVKISSVSYLKKTKVDIDFNAKVDTDKMKFVLLDNSFQFNALKLNAEGELAMPDAGIKMDLQFNAPTTSFASVLSMIPSAYTKDFSAVKTKGNFSFSGYVKGTYTGEENYPAFALDLKVDKAAFHYPDLPMGIEDIAINLGLRSPSSDLDKMTIDLANFHMKLGANPFDAKLLLKTPISDPTIDTEIEGRINLAELTQAFPIEGVDKLDGTIEANLSARTRMSYVELEQYDKVDMKGLLAISKMNYDAKGLPPVVLDEMKMNFTPNKVNLEHFDLRIGKSDLQGNGQLDNILTFFSRDKVMKGILNLQSNYLDLNELTDFDEGEPEKTTTDSEDIPATDMSDTSSANEEEIFDRFEFFANADFNKIKYSTYEVNELNAKGSFSPSTAILDNLSFDIGEVDIQVSGRVDNVFGYLFEGNLLKGNVNLSSSYMNLNSFMATEEGTATAPKADSDNGDDTSSTSSSEGELEPIEIPKNIDFHFSSQFATLVYDNYTLKNAKAELHVHNQILDIIELSAAIFGGKIVLNGEYNTQNPEQPSFTFGYDIIDIDFQETVKTVATLVQLLPIFKSIYGTLSSDFRIRGILNKDLSLDMKTISADGTLRTFNAVLKDFPPLKKLSSQLKMKDMSEIIFKDTKNFFTVENGRINFQPFVNEHKGIGMTFGGSHGLDNTLDYDLTLRVPRKILSSTPIGATASNAVNSGLALFSQQASKLGIDLNQSDFIDIGIDITGEMKNPKYKVKLLGAENGNGETLGDQLKNNLKDEMEKVKAETEAKAREEIEKIKAEAKARAEAEKERLRKEAEERTARLKAEAEARAKAQAEKLAQQVGIPKDSIAGALGGKIGSGVTNILNGGNSNGGGNKWTPPWKKKKN